jgi:K+/H+ antiporter YhaU regulatory subunit KhtT
LIACALFIWLGMVDKVTNAMVTFMRKRGFLKQAITDWDILHREGDYAVFRIAMHHFAGAGEVCLGNSPLWKPTISIIAVEREGKVITSPNSDQKIQAGDMLLCYGAAKEVMDLTRQS